MSARPRIVVLTAGGTNPAVVINALARHFGAVTVLEEPPESKGTILKRRIRRCGLLPALGQMATMLVSKVGKRFAEPRMREIITAYGLSTDLLPGITTLSISSVNGEDCRAQLARLSPDVIVTVSCRLIGRQTLAALACPVINLHCGINPAYRGQMGGYWALALGDRGNFGATVHLVDAGTDTGATLFEVRPDVSKRDTMLTYPLLLTAAAVAPTIAAVDAALAKKLQPKEASGPSALRYNPPIWTWLANGLTKAIW